MSGWDAAQTLGLVAAMAIGWGLARVPGLSPWAEKALLPLLMAMLGGVFLQVSWLEAFRVGAGGRTALAALLLNFGWTPLWAGVLGAGFLADVPGLRLGFLLLMVTPCTDWYLAFTAIAGGNVPLSAALLPINLALQLVLWPFYLPLAGGAPHTRLGLGALAILGGPLVGAALLRPVAARWGQPLFTMALLLAVTAMFAAAGPTVTATPRLWARLVPPLLGFYLSTGLLAWALGRALHLPRPEQRSLLFVTLARNSPTALAVATAAFPDDPTVAIALVGAPLLELPVLATLSQGLRRLNPHG